MNYENKLHFDVDEKRTEKAIITGGTEGIGRAIALELAGQNHQVAICARTRRRLDEIGSVDSIKAFQIDLSETEKIPDFIKQGSDEIGGITILILNAAVTGIRESVEYTTRVDRDAQLILVESAASALRASNGRIIFITSSQAKKFIEGHEHYGQAKKDVEDWLREFSAKPENQNVHIILVNPGRVDTRMIEEVINYGKGAIGEMLRIAKSEGKFRDPVVVGRIIAKMSVSGMMFNQESNQYDLPIGNNEIVTITDKNIEFEKVAM